MESTLKQSQQEQHKKRTEDVLATVQTRFAVKVRRWLAGMAGAGIKGIYLTEGLRSKDRQSRLFGLGRTRDQCKMFGVDPAYAQPREKKVTNCAPAKSNHCKGLAVDWNAWEYGEPEKQKAARIAKQCGMTSGVTWHMRDDCHLENK